MGQAEVKIFIGQLKIRHRSLVADIKGDFILGMDLISRNGLAVDPVAIKSSTCISVALNLNL